MPAAPNSASLQTQLQDIIELYGDLRSSLATVVTNMGTLTSNLESERAGAIQAGADRFRQLLAEAWRAGDPLIPHIYDWVQLADKSLDNLSLDDAISIMESYWRTNSITVDSRAFSYGSISAGGGNTGSGRIVRLTVNEHAEAIENTIGADSWAARCVADVSAALGGLEVTQRGEEMFLLESGDASKDGLEQLGAGIRTTLAAVHSDNSLVQNAGFDTYDNASAPASIVGWDTDITLAGDGTDVDGLSTTIYLPKKASTETRYSLRVKTDIVLTQRFDANAIKLFQGQPLFAELNYNRSVGTAVGTLKLDVGSHSSATVTLGSASSGWQQLLCIGDDENSYYANFVEDPLTVEITITITSGTLLIDDLILASMPFVGNLPTIIVPGATAFRAGQPSANTGDTFTWSDTCSENGVIQREFVRLTGRQLPHQTTGSLGDP